MLSCLSAQEAGISEDQDYINFFVSQLVIITMHVSGIVYLGKETCKGIESRRGWF